MQTTGEKWWQEENICMVQAITAIQRRWKRRKEWIFSPLFRQDTCSLNLWPLAMWGLYTFTCYLMQRNCEKRVDSSLPQTLLGVTLMQKSPSSRLCLALQHLWAAQPVQWVDTGQDGDVMEKPCCTGDPAAPGASRAATRAPKQALSPGLWEGWGPVRGGALVQRKPGKRGPVGLMSLTQEPVPQLWGAGWASVTVIEREKLQQHSDTSHLQCWKISDSFVSFKWWCKLKGMESFTSLH